MKTNDHRREGEATAEPALLPDGWHAPRKRPTHGVILTPDAPSIVFLTICTEKREPWLADPEVHGLLKNIWRQAAGWLVGRYVLMPDHIHMFAGWAGGKWSLETWVQFWKARLSVCHKVQSHRWQSGHWDTRMTSREQCESKWEYVVNNPVRHGLVKSPELWPYSGMVHELEGRQEEQARR
jgi:putative transposase